MTYEISFLIRGIVQGVGFRPFCARLARKMGLGGSVRNTSDGVEITLLGTRDNITEYINRLQAEKPDVSTITSIDKISERHSEEPSQVNFVIEKSMRMERQRVLIPPDIATCQDCLREMEDPSDKRYRYPFINCTNCGPRYTIIGWAEDWKVEVGVVGRFTETDIYLIVTVYEVTEPEVW